jgi:hypothetical protein
MKIESKAVEFIFQDTEIHFLLGNEKNVPQLHEVWEKVRL